MSETPAEAELAKLKRRQKRNMRAAWARGFLQGICAQLGPGDIVLDCGANIGDVTAPLAATGATVLAFEPDPYAFERLSRRVGEAPNVTLHAAAVGVAAGEVSLRRAANFEDNPKGASVKSTILDGGRGISAEAEDSVLVQVIDLPALLRDLVARHGTIALVKMDIEGAELDILEAMEAEALFAPIRCTLAETHERKFRDLRPRFRALKERVAAAYPPEKVNLEWI